MEFYLAKVFTFDPQSRNDYVFPDTASAAGLTFGEDFVLRLKADADDEYPTTANLRCRTPAITGSAITGWASIACSRGEPEIDPGSAETSVRFRLANTDGERWWSGVTWAAPAAGNWNTLAEIQAHLATFPINKGLRVVVNLKTTDETLTPLVSRISVAYKVEIGSFLEDLIYETFIDWVQDTIRGEASVAVEWGGGTNDDYDPAAGEDPLPNFNAILRAVLVNPTGADPTGNILHHYDATAKKVYLTQAIAAGRFIQLTIRYAPIVAVTTHPDYDELPGLPAITVDSIEEEFVAQAPEGEEFVNEGSFAGIQVLCPRVVNYNLVLRIAGMRALDIVRLGDSLERAIRVSPVLQSPSTGVEASMTILDSFSVAPRPNVAFAFSGEMSLRLTSAQKWSAAAETGTGVKKFTVTGDVEVVIE